MCGISFVCHVLHYITLKINTTATEFDFRCPCFVWIPPHHCNWSLFLVLTLLTGTPCCVVCHFISQGVRVTNETGSHRRVVGSREPAKPDSCRYWQGRGAPTCCVIGRITNRRVRVTGKADSRRCVAGSHEPAKPAFCRTPRWDRWMCVTCYAPTKHNLTVQILRYLPTYLLSYSNVKQ